MCETLPELPPPRTRVVVMRTAQGTTRDHGGRVMRKVVSVAFAVVAAAALWVTPAAGGRPRGRDAPPSSASATRRSRARPAAGRATPTARQQRRRARLDRVLRRRRARRRSTAAIAPRRRRSASPSAATCLGQPRLLGRAHLHAALQQRQRLQAGPGLLRRRRRPHRPGEGAAAVRRHPQREDGRRAHRGQRLRLRRHRPAVRDSTGSRRPRGGRTTATTTRA